MLTADQFLLITEPLPEPMLLLTGDGLILAANSAALKQLSAQHICGKNLSELVGNSSDQVAHYVGLCRRNRSLVLGVAEFSADYGGIACRLEGVLVQPADSGGPGLIMIRLMPKSAAVEQFAELTRRIDELNREVQRRRALEQALRDADRRKDEFLATLAHELRNPLAPIRNSLEILKIPRVDAATVQETRAMMERQVHHLVRLVDDLLDVSRVMRGKIELRREMVELAAIVARAVETAKPIIDTHGHQLHISLPATPMLLDADPVRLSQVLGNLLANSAKYTEPRGDVWLTAASEGGMAVLRVRDNGIGIAAEMLPVIFDLFVQVDYTTTRSQGGLGIGLTLVRNLVEMHGGTVEATSAGLGKGSEFIVRLPLLPRDAAAPADANMPVDAAVAPPSGHRLLVVDDNEDAAVSLGMLLRLQGHEVCVVHDGASALERAAQFRPTAVFLDLGMPGMDGYEVARRLRQQPGLERVPLAALTGWGQQEDRRRTADAGFDHHLIKPPDSKVLEELLGRIKLSDG